MAEDLHIRIIDAATGELLRELTLDPAKRYQGTGRPPDPHANRKLSNQQPVGSGVSDVLRHHSVGLTGFELRPLVLSLSPSRSCVFLRIEALTCRKSSVLTPPPSSASP